MREPNRIVPQGCGIETVQIIIIVNLEIRASTYFGSPFEIKAAKLDHIN
jgi:hypothetical protein